MLLPIKSFSQKISNLKRYELLWVVTHPFVAHKAYKVSLEARAIANSYIKSDELDGDYNGGMVDAFRHTFWMASLVQVMRPIAAYKLGLAHEKGNKLDYDKKRLEEGSLPDSVACLMDMKNNYVGIEIGQENFGKSADTLINIVKNAVINGRCWKINKDKEGNFLDINNNIIPKAEWLGKWYTSKIIIASDK